ncbi:MAG TPA: Gfo/Idh/MocA family oxidoreductase [Thermoguttaceae bacterium]|nr:Gfo/Idh/MocA family oxidoreductase [Thermoguttaceae bacterium]
MKRRTNRRRFLTNAGLAGVGLWVGARATTARGRSPNEKLNIGIIGSSGRGGSNTKSVSSENIVALCDVDDKRMEQAAKPYPNAKKYVDWRKLVDQKDLDAVVVSTTDHTHAIACVWAMNRGLSVYCEKPLAHSPYEARVMQETYLKNKDKLATQMGTQIHATDNYRRLVELVQSGAIGPVREAHVWCGREGLKDGERPTDTPPVPDGLHWDLWLGPAPLRPYHPRYLPGCMTWEQWWDFGNGCLGDMGSHLIDLPFWALKLRDPLTVEAEGAPLRKETYPEWLVVHWEHPARGDMPPLKLHWYDGIQRPKLKVPGHDIAGWHKGIVFVGDDGILLGDYGKKILVPEEKYKDFKAPEPWIEPSLGHHQEWIHAAKTGAPTLCNFDYSGKLVEHNLLGAVAFRVGKKLTWDPKAMKATGVPEADPYIRPEYREGWKLDG